MPTHLNKLEWTSNDSLLKIQFAQTLSNRIFISLRIKQIKLPIMTVLIFRTHLQINHNFRSHTLKSKRQLSLGGMDAMQMNETTSNSMISLSMRSKPRRLQRGSTDTR